MKSNPKIVVKMDDCLRRRPEENHWFFRRIDYWILTFGIRLHQCIDQSTFR